MREPFKMPFGIYEDPGHAWVEVPIELLKRLGIHKNITPYSYMRGDFAYLEEDCDYPTFRNAYRACFGEIPTLVEHDEAMNHDSIVRSYRHYEV